MSSLDQLVDAAGMFYCCIGIVIICVVAVTVPVLVVDEIKDVLDLDTMKSIENNTTVTVNGVQFTVPVTNESSMTENASVIYYPTEELGLDITNDYYADNYYDRVYNMSIDVIDADSHNVTPDFSKEDTREYGSGRVYTVKKNVGDKIILIQVFGDAKGLAELVINSAVPV